MFLLAELERETKMLQFDVCHKAIDQNLDCGCDSYSAPKQKQNFQFWKHLVAVLVFAST